jgi:hypothetical protein
MQAAAHLRLLRVVAGHHPSARLLGAQQLSLLL